RDYPVIMAITMFGAVLTVLGNLIADILYAVLDPRIEY
ncbi:MAG: diguanylate cyclase, partial [Anaerobacillus sp.]